MRIGIFVVMAGRQAGGPETYEHSLVRFLVELDQKNEYDVFCLSETAANSFSSAHDRITTHVLRPSVRWVSIPLSLPLELMRSGVELLHATYIPLPFSPKQYVFTLHDMTMFTHAELYPAAIGWRLRRLVSMGLRGARQVVCVSKSTRDVAADMFDIPAERLTVVHHGIDSRFRPAPPEEVVRVRDRYGLGEHYILFVGRLEPRKNVVRLLEAFDAYRRDSRANVKLVLAGKKTWAATDVEQAIQRLRLADDVIELGYASDTDLPALYSGASVFAFPSLSEGFGFPILEAMACGTPVVTSNLSSLPEVAGDAAVLVDPYSVEEIAGAFADVLSDATLRDRLREQGLERAKQFTWCEAAKRTLNVYARHLTDSGARS